MLELKQKTISSVQDLVLDDYVERTFGKGFSFQFQGRERNAGTYKYEIPLGEEEVQDVSLYESIAKGNYANHDPAHILHALFLGGHIPAGEIWVEIFY